MQLLAFSSSPPRASTWWRLGIALLMTIRNLAVSVCLTYIVWSISSAGAEVRLTGLELPLGLSLLFLSHVTNPIGLFVSPLGDVNISWTAG